MLSDFPQKTASFAMTDSTTSSAVFTSFASAAVSLLTSSAVSVSTSAEFSFSPFAVTQSSHLLHLQVRCKMFQPAPPSRSISPELVPAVNVSPVVLHLATQQHCLRDVSLQKLTYEQVQYSEQAAPPTPHMGMIPIVWAPCHPATNSVPDRTRSGHRSPSAVAYARPRQ